MKLASLVLSVYLVSGLLLWWFHALPEVERLGGRMQARSDAVNNLPPPAVAEAVGSPRMTMAATPRRFSGWLYGETALDVDFLSWGMMPPGQRVKHLIPVPVVVNYENSDQYSGFHAS